MPEIWEKLQVLKLFEHYEDEFVRYRRIIGGLLLTEKIGSCPSTFIPMEGSYRDFFIKIRAKAENYGKF